MISRVQVNGVRRLFWFERLCRYSTDTAAAQPPQTHFLVDYLINSLGLSKDEALSATKKVTLWKSSRNDPDLVVNFLQKLGLNKTQIRSIISAHPSLLTSNVDKTLQPKIQVLQDLGISGSDIIRILVYYKSLLTKRINSGIRTPVEYLRNLLGSDEKAAMAIKKYCLLVDNSAPKVIASNVELLQKIGFSVENISRMMLVNPRRFMQKPQRLEDILNRVENDFGFSRDSKMFYHGIVGLSSLSKSTLDKKIGIFRSLGWSDATIHRLVRKFPSILTTSEDKMRKVWNFFTIELGCPADYLATYPYFFSLNLERRVKPRSEVLRILNEKKLNKKKVGLSSVLNLTESKFINNYLLPYQNEIPNVFNSYFKITGREETGKL